MSNIEVTDTDREGAIEMASALTIKVDQVYERNDSLEAENDSLKTAFQAVSQENEHLRKYAEKLVRQRYAVMRKVDLYESKMKVIYAEAAETLRATHPPKQDAAVVRFAPPRVKDQLAEGNQ
jgi:FtsZ-binding cell division protein ZapB